MAEKTFKRGDRVAWNTSQGKTTGKVKRKLTSPIDIKGFHANASESEPMYLVESDASGAEAAHKPEALTRLKG
ncbi:MAG: DUF2945 domain-containing protein [Deinococcota bacterium]|jgi:hypothetical protein|nr:DUF2945 domain-containing protein [Deinococcota bacterium]